MSFDALLSLLFILLFVVGPLLRRLSGGKQKAPPPPNQPRPSSPPQTAGGESRRTVGGDEQADGGALGRRLEEARRRVLEAMGEVETSVGEGRGESTGVPPRHGPVERELDWQPSPEPVKPFLRSTEQVARPREAGSARDATAAPFPAEQKTRRRRRARKASKMPSERVPALDRNGVLGGMIWHEILSEPVSKRGTRRASSRLRSR